MRIQITELTKAYRKGSQPALSDLNLEIALGTFGPLTFQQVGKVSHSVLSLRDRLIVSEIILDDRVFRVDYNGNPLVHLFDPAQRPHPFCILQELTQMRVNNNQIGTLLLYSRQCFDAVGCPPYSVSFRLQSRLVQSPQFRIILHHQYLSHFLHPSFQNPP